MTSMKHISSLIAATFALAALTGCGSRGQKASSSASEVSVKVQEVAFSSPSRELSYSGTLEEGSAISLSFPAGGTVEKVFVKEGDKVRKGDTLALTDRSSALAAYESASAVLSQAKDGYSRMEKLYREGAVAEVKWVEMQTELSKAESMYKIARKSLDNCSLVAPESGWVGTVSAKAGSNMAPGLSAVVLLKTDNLIARISVPEREISRYSVGQKAVVSVPAVGKSIEGKISEVALRANPLNHTYPVLVKIANSASDLRPGMLCNVVPDALSEGEKALVAVIPSGCVLLETDNSRFVWVVSDEHKAQRRKVVTGDYVKGGVAILGGLEEGDKVIVEGYQKVSEGMKVSVR